MKTISQESSVIQYLIKKDTVLNNIVLSVGEISYKVIENEYSFLIFTIIGQMLSNKIGDVLYSRFEKLCNFKIEPIVVSRLKKENITSIGVSNRKATAIIALTNEMIRNVNYLKELKNYEDSDVIKILSNIDGIGPWTAKMFLIFCLDREDVLPTEDGAFITAFKLAYNFKDDTRDKRYIKEYCTKWKPYSSYAVRYIYKAFDAGLL